LIGLKLSGPLIIRKELGSVLKPPAFATAPARRANSHECTPMFTAKKEGHE
jgi:hypothetical protein